MKAKDTILGIFEKLSIEPRCFPCYNFQPSPEVPPMKASVVIVPFKFVPSETEDGKEMLIIGWSCSLGQYCHFKCRYAKGWEER